jgi:hypothetical protein
MAQEDAAQAEDEAREVFERNLLGEFALFSMMAHQYMDEGGTLGSFLDWAWARRKRELEPAYTRAWEDE